MNQLNRVGYETFTNEEELTNGERPKEKPLLLPGATITCSQLNYVIDVTPPEKLCGTIRKTILTNISGIFKPGMNAILGPTGSGKTTLLDTLAGRIEEKGIDGEVLVNGQKMPINFNRTTGYVIQDDVVKESLTVRENISFSANLRRSFKSSDETKSTVSRVIEELGLASCADTRIGTALKRGVSGGERRRTSIGMELIISPSVLFLDEPTTGLDSSTALAVMNSLYDLSLKNTTVVFTVHQPRYSIFKLFDQLTLLSVGHCIYHGPSNEAIQFFGSLGFEIEEHDNPPDFFMDIINSDSSAFRIHGKNNNEGLEKENSDSSALAGRLAVSYRSSSCCLKVLEEIDRVSADSNEKQENQNGNGAHLQKEYAVSCIFQFWCVLRRNLLDFIRNPTHIQLKIAFMLFWGVLLGLLYFQITTTYPVGIENRRGLMAFHVLHVMFLSSMTADILIEDRGLMIHECASGYYRVAAYFLAKMCSVMILVNVLPLLLCTAITYYMTGLRSDGFGVYYFTMLFLSLCSSALGMAIGASVSSFATGDFIVSIVCILMMITGGAFSHFTEANMFFSILQYVNLAYHAFRTVCVNEFRNLTLYKYNGTQISEVLPDAGNEFLESQGILPTSEWELWKGFVALAAMWVIFSSAAYIQLLRIKKLK